METLPWVPQQSERGSLALSALNFLLGSSPSGWPSVPSEAWWAGPQSAIQRLTELGTGPSSMQLWGEGWGSEEQAEKQGCEERGGKDDR